MLPRVAIPSYKRSGIIANLTLGFLEHEGYPPDRIYIFVVPEEVQLYRALPAHLYREIVVGVPGLKEQRNFITNYFPEDEILIHMDDDISTIKTSPAMSFLDLVRRGVAALGPEVGIWGIMPNDDGRKMRANTTTHLAHLIGTFTICRNHSALQLTTAEKDDFERTILYFKKYGKVARYQGAGAVTKYEKTPGGLQSAGRRERMLLAIAYIIEKYPQFVKRVMKPKGEDIILDWRAKSQ